MTKKKSVFSDVLAITAMQMLIQLPMYEEEQLEERAPRKIRHEWDNKSLSKAERRGKTYEEIQELRKAKYEAMKDDADNDKCLS